VAHYPEDVNKERDRERSDDHRDREHGPRPARRRGGADMPRGYSSCVPTANGHFFYDFETSACSPLAAYSPYFYVFAPHRSTVFHSTSITGRGMSFGNYPLAVRIHGHLIACNPAATKFVVALFDSINFSVGCEPPQH
jgi:hypothetical protein